MNSKYYVIVMMGMLYSLTGCSTLEHSGKAVATSAVYSTVSSASTEINKKISKGVHKLFNPEESEKKEQKDTTSKTTP